MSPWPPALETSGVIIQNYLLHEKPTVSPLQILDPDAHGQRCGMAKELFGEASKSKFLLFLSSPSSQKTSSGSQKNQGCICLLESGGKHLKFPESLSQLQFFGKQRDTHSQG